MYPAELEIKDTTESTTSASYLDLLLSIWRDGQLHTSIYDKRDDFNFHITNFPFLSSNIPSSPAYGVFISQLIRYARACSSYECFILRARRLSIKLLKQGYLVERLKSSFRKFYGRYGDLIEQYGVTLSRMLKQQNRYLSVIIVSGYFSFIRSFTCPNFPSKSNSYHNTSLSMSFGCWHLSGIPLCPLHLTVYTIAWQRKFEPQWVFNINLCILSG